MELLAFWGPPKAVLAQVFPGPGDPGIPIPPGPGKTSARTAMGTPKLSKVIIFLDRYREFRTSPKRLWTPQKRRPEQLFWPAEPKIDQKLPQPPWRGGGGCPASPCELGTPLPPQGWLRPLLVHLGLRGPEKLFWPTFLGGPEAFRRRPEFPIGITKKIPL